MTDAAPPPLAGPAIEALRLLRADRNVILYGAPGTGKTYAAMRIRDHWEHASGPGSVLLTTFHPSYAYEDFIQGWRPATSSTGFELVDGVLFQAAKLAEDYAKLSTTRPVLLLIDEINRADVARVFGEVVTYLEHDKRGIPFTTALDRTRTRSLPPSLYVLGTMNTADKSISLLDVALRRRFSFVHCAPDPSAFVSLNWVSSRHGVALANVLRGINTRLARHKVDMDRHVGHALLAVPQAPDAAIDQLLSDRLRYEVLPLVEDYLFGDTAQVADVLPGLIDPASGEHLLTDPAQLGAVLTRLAS
jgi:5-methylcytosine-specific restriction protein B